MRELYESGKLAQALRDARDYTLSIYADLDLARLRFPYVRSVNPPLWELAHIAWFQEHWCLRWHDGMLKEAALLSDADAMLNSALIEHRARWHLPALDWETVHDYLDRTLAATLVRLTHEPAQDAYFPLLALYHEDMHAEAFLMSLQTLGLPRPSRLPAAARPPADGMQNSRVRFAGGAFEMGTPDGPHFVFDNERHSHRVQVAPFELAAATVTQGEFRAFVEEGGYRERHWWSEQGWQWRQANGRLCPRDWRLEGDRWLVRRFDRWESLADEVALMHVNAHEAEAYAAFAGGRLPTEPEWEFAARAGLGEEEDRHPWGAEARSDACVNLDARYGGPVASAALASSDSATGLRQMLGNVWEWTSSAFLPYPGFEPGPYKEYSQPWFGNHRVLRGGSFATRRRLVHNRWRNFYLPDRDDVFAGIRVAYSCRGAG